MNTYIFDFPAKWLGGTAVVTANDKIGARAALANLLIDQKANAYDEKRCPLVWDSETGGDKIIADGDY